MCRVITVERRDLPAGHDFVIVRRRGHSRLLVFATPDDKAQLEARIAALQCDEGVALPAGSLRD